MEDSLKKTSRRPSGVTPITSSRELHGELIETSTMRAWISLEPMSQESYDALPLPPAFMHVALGRTAMDEHWFTRSPDRDEDGPMSLREIGGHPFGHCARSLGMSQPFGPTGPREVLVEKHHGGCFESGRRVPLLVDPEGRRFVHIVESGRALGSLAMPEGFELEWLSLTEDWAFQLPTPTTAYFFDTGDSFQGPIDRSSSEG